MRPRMIQWTAADIPHLHDHTAAVTAQGGIGVDGAEAVAAIRSAGLDQGAPTCLWDAPDQPAAVGLAT